MLTILGRRRQLCDNASRRDFLKIGGLALGGLSLPQILRAEDQAGIGRSHRAVIMVFLSGGPPHQDMVDLKPDAPAEFRGEFRPMRTSVPGIHICEHLPRLAAMMDRFAIIRSMVGAEDRHAAFQCMTGRTFGRQPSGGWPALGSVVSRLQGPVSPSVAPFVGLSPRMQTSTWADPGQPGFLGHSHAPFKPNADGMADMVLQGVSMDRLADRRALLSSFDNWRRQLDKRSDQLQASDTFTQQALSILTSNRLAEALDLEREDSRVRDRYGRGSPEPAGYGDAGPLLNDYFLAARRLVEVGVRCVTLAYGRWDWHGRPHGTTFENARNHLPMLDLGLTALVEDLHERGLDQDVSVVVWGEFGRTPRINRDAGRDHWPAVSCAILAGGGMRTGQVIGETTRLAEHARERPVNFQEVFATLYHNLGIDTNTATVTDFTGRPHYLVDNNAQPIRELIS
ncbi:MAG: DUF1501 domain-containing protein [Planctomycetes bacterium]|nr:DUF1501 domain-containing protein [Planctomycetota bacterium]